jgi:hypothetical protein
MRDGFESDLGVQRQAHTPLFNVDHLGRYIGDSDPDFAYDETKKQSNHDQKKFNHERQYAESSCQSILIAWQ